ncbi:disulfide bond formation protein B [Eikenella sp. S3360]|uniref:Disulfide bond formation protein B n=1 Tax=Eikenella glucosivorans TaxID=2766967 RepID=A0ABS0NCV9_9NEIS|nr:disulfide bond formation protein B [Eikenella glucosivorans]MBH5330150.1 disulfide bond formation protein B [Eikenella glucosivorans]
MPTYRKLLLGVFAVCAACTAMSLYMQYGRGMDPCVMCIIQRVSLIFAGLLALLTALLPQGRCRVRALSAFLVSIPTVWGGWTAASQLHLQSLPLDQQPSCGAPWSFRLQGAPLFDLYEPIIRGYGECGKVEYFLGVPFAWWSLLACLFILAVLWGGWWKLRGK